MFSDLKFTFPALLLLPVEMWATILRYLDDKTLLSAALTSKRFMRVCKGDPILRKRVSAQILLERRLLRNATLDREMGITVIRNYAPNVINVNQNKTVAKKVLSIRIPRVERNPVLRLCTSNQDPVVDTQSNKSSVEMPRDEQDLKIHKSPPTGCELHVSPFDIASIPVIKEKASSRGRKACKSQVISLSPYKNDLEQSLSTPKKPPLKRKVFPKPQPTRGASNKQKKSDADSEDSSAANESFVPANDDMDIDDISQIVPDDKDATCLFCDGRFSEDHRGELWVYDLLEKENHTAEDYGQKEDNENKLHRANERSPRKYSSEKQPKEMTNSKKTTGKRI
ncbi:hypothetical protein FQA39_LY14551 [Lamprigera yunnana]|nr:hypothetical protein FQA39_LY14551 [Lamprigera yunnana]